jgi:hypothetical protein
LHGSKVLKVLKVLNFSGTGKTRIFGADQSRLGRTAQHVSFRVAARNLVGASPPATW